MRVSASIMAHPQRAKLVQRLLADLDADLPVAWDTKPATPRGDQRWNVAVQAWTMHDPDADYHLVIQDDAMPCPDLMDALPAVVAGAPGPGPVSLYMGARPGTSDIARLVQRANQRDAVWIGRELLGWGVAFAVHTSEIEAMLAACAGSNRAGHRQPYDLRIGKYFRDVRHVPTWHTWPSLVDHDMSTRSLVGNIGSHRRAYRVLRDSPLTVDWQASWVVDERAPQVVTRT